MHQALYRKWRPKTFEDVCGQEHITSVLRYEVSENAVSHAYLFCGSRGTGKTTCAKILAKAVNCLSPVNGSPCGKCAACAAIENGTATDVLEMDAASNNGVEAIRDIRDEVVYSPSVLKYRVYIVDEVHMLSASAFNALLKTLEEPPAHVLFILATTELQKLPATIISRCQRFDFRRIAAPVLAARVSYIAKEEGLDITPEAANRIARIAAGGMRDAISLLELCAGVEGQITPETVNEMTGSTGRDSVVGLTDAVAAADYDTILSVIATAVNSSRDLTVFWQDLLSLYRDLLVIKTTDAADKYLDLTDAEAKELHALAGKFGKGRLLLHCKLLEDAFFAMQKAGAVKRVIAELTLLRMCDPTLDTGAEALLARVEKLEDALSGGISLPPPAAAPTLPTEEKKEKTPPNGVKNTPPERATATECATVTERATATERATTERATTKEPTPPVTGRVLRRVRGFADCVERVRRENSMLASFLTEAKAFLDEAGKPVIRMPNEFALSLLNTPKERALLAGALSAELKESFSPGDLCLEAPNPEAEAGDTVIDELLSAAEKED